MCKVRKNRQAEIGVTAAQPLSIDYDQVIRHERDQSARFLKWLVWGWFIALFALVPLNLLSIAELRPERGTTGFLAQINFTMPEGSGWAAFGVLATLVVALQIAVRSMPTTDVDLEASIARQLFLENIAIAAGIGALVVASLVAFGDGIDLSSIDLAGEIAPVGVGVLIAAFACDASWASRDRYGKAISDRKSEIVRERLLVTTTAIRLSTTSSGRQVALQIVVILAVIVGSVVGFGISFPEIGVPLTALLQVYCFVAYLLISWQARDSIIRGNLGLGYAQYALLGLAFCAFWLLTTTIFMKVFVEDWRDFVVALALALLLQSILLLVSITLCITIPWRRTRGLMLSVILRSLEKATVAPAARTPHRSISGAAWLALILLPMPPASIAAGVIALRAASPVSRGTRVMAIVALSISGIFLVALVLALIALALVNPPVAGDV